MRSVWKQPVNHINPLWAGWQDKMPYRNFRHPALDIISTKNWFMSYSELSIAISPIMSFWKKASGIRSPTSRFLVAVSTSSLRLIVHKALSIPSLMHRRLFVSTYLIRGGCLIGYSQRMLVMESAWKQPIMTLRRISDIKPCLRICSSSCEGQ